MLPPGTPVGPYEVIASLGAGGMGEVYRARDTRLGRDVAIKVLPPAFAIDATRVARFEQEARAIATLSHPNVLAIFDSGQATVPGHDGPVLFVVTELLEGETLGQRLAQGAIPVRKAIDIACQIARGLSAAHEKNLVHRDLKPDNVFLTTAGHVKILDFGLARAIAVPESSSATETRVAITDAGMVVGTVGYMSPEQVRAGVVDARTDLFALGAVLYEMLSGQRAFRRETAAETMTAILKEDPPDLTSSRADLSPALDRIVRHCLEKAPTDRFQTARDVAFALETLSGSTASSPAPAVSVTAPRTGGRERVVWLALVAALLAVVTWFWWRPPAAPSPAFTAPHRAIVLPPDGVTLPTDTTPARRLALSPDGTQLAFIGYVAGRGRLLFVQSLNETTARLVEGSDDASGPFWSSDSKSIAFAADSRLLRIDVAAKGLPLPIGPGVALGDWRIEPDGKELIVTGPAAGRGGTLQRLNPRDGSLTPFFPSGPATESSLYPTILPDGRVLFSYSETNALQGVYVTTEGAAEKKRITTLTPDVEATNFKVASGYLVRVRNQLISASTFDVNTLAVGDERHELGGPVETVSRGSAAFSVSTNGVLAYQPSATLTGSSLDLVDRTGRLIRTLGEPGEFSNLELSPDGKSLAISVTDKSTRTGDIWVVDVMRGVRTRITSDPSNERSSAWTADGRGLIYTSKGLDLYQRTIGSAEETPFIKDGVSKDPHGPSPDGQYFTYRATGPGTRNDIWVKKVGEAPKPFMATPFDENYSRFSPQGGWLAYVSDESGRSEVYLTEFPSGQGKWRVSTEGGSFPHWRHDGKELVYLTTDNTLMSVAIATSPGAVTIGKATALFRTRAKIGPGGPFDMTPDGQQFVVNNAIPAGGPPSIVVIYNWPALIPRKP